MGDICAQYEGQCFIEEFNEDAVRLFGIRAPFVESQGLELDDRDLSVVFAMTLRYAGETTKVLLPLTFFACSLPPEDLVDLVCTFFELDEEEALLRCKDARLIDEFYAPPMADVVALHQGG